MTDVYVSPTEPPELHALGTLTMLPEEYGADIMWESRLGLVGVQRKVFPEDFLASVHDNRLNFQLQQMKQLDVAILLLEGPVQWTTEGLLYGRAPRRKVYSKHRDYAWDRVQLHNYLASVQMRGVQVHHTDSLRHTIECVNGLRVWTDKREHSSLDSRGAAKSAVWYDLSNPEFFTWFYQALLPSGIGPKTAAALYERLGVILRLTVGLEELESVPGIGKLTAAKIVRIWHEQRTNPDQ